MPKFNHRHHRGRAGGFSLVKLLVVIGIIAVLIGLLLPALSKAREQARAVACASNERQTGICLQAYINDWRGWIFPPDRGDDVPLDPRWPVFVFKPAVWNPPVLICPSDLEPKEAHSYILNNHIVERKIKATTRSPGGRSPSDLVVMGEKKTDTTDYYMDTGEDFDSKVELYRHGVRIGSNYLFLDWHVSVLPSRAELVNGVDPWDFPSTTAKP